MVTYEDFQRYKQRLADGVGYQLYNILQDCHNRHANSGFDLLLQDVEKVNQKLRSHRFRIAIIGEFSRGKSTLVNALVGEQIQPVRAIACSGTITVLRHGKEKRVICHYKDGQVQEVPHEKYQDLVKISKEAARKYVSDELARSQIEEVIFEHPNLELCRNGVEIVDSPGLNEHSERERITQKLIQDADAVIFLLLASQILTHNERELIQDISKKLCGGKENEVANNLFLAVNKIDELDSEEDWQDVRDTVEEFVFSPSAKDRIHYISTKESFKASLMGEENDFQQRFREFTKAIEQFVTSDRGKVEFDSIKQKVIELISTTFNNLYSIQNNLDVQLQEYESEKQKEIEKIGDFAGRSVKTLALIKKHIEQEKIKVRQELEKSWNNSIEDLLENRLFWQSKNWISKFDDDPVWHQKAIIEDYTEQLESYFAKEIAYWQNNQKKFVNNHLSNLDEIIWNEIDRLPLGGNVFAKDVFAKKLRQEFNFNCSKKDFYGNLFEWIGGIIEDWTSFNLFGARQSIKDAMKKRVIQEGSKKFKETAPQIYADTYSTVVIVLENRLKAVKTFFSQAIANGEQQLERADRAFQTARQEYETEKAWLDQKRQDLDRVRQELETLLNQLPKLEEN